MANDQWQVIGTSPVASPSASAPTASADGGWSVESQTPIDWTTNPKGEGLYNLFGRKPTADNPEAVGQIAVPFSRVEQALGSGLTWSGSAEEPRYLKDKAFAGKSKTWMTNPYDKVQAAMQPVPEGQGNPAISNADRAFARTIAGVPGFLVNLGKAYRESLYTGDPRTLVDMTDPGEMIRGLKNQFAADYAKDPKLAVQNLEGTIAGLGVTAAIAHGAENVVEGAGPAARRFGKGVFEHAASTTPREIRKMAAGGEQANIDAAAEHLPKSEAAAHETRGKEIEYERQLHETAETARQEHDKALAETEAKNQQIREKARKKYDDEVAALRERNLVKNARHQEDKTRIEEENAAANHMLSLRIQAEAEVTQATANYFTEEATVKSDAKTIENQAWDDWRKTTNAATTDVDMAPVLKVIEDQITKTPEAANILRNVETQEGALDPDTQKYLDTQKEVMESLGYGDDYEGLSPAKTQDVDELVSRKVSRTSAPVNLPDVKTMTLEQIHAVQSNIGFKRFNRTYPPDVRYAMGEIYDALGDLLETESIKLGGGKELRSAKEITRQYQKAFGRKPYEPVTEVDLREREANPDAYKERKEQDRLNNAKVWSNKLVKSYEAVKEARAKLKKLPTEEQLRKQLQQVPQPPSIGDLRPGYELEQEPTYEPPSVGDLRSGYALKELPTPPEGGFQAHAKRTVKPPDRDLGPDRPQGEQYGNAEIEKMKHKRIESLIESLHSHALRRALYATMTAIPFAIFEGMRSGAGTGVEAAATGMVGGAAVFFGAHILADILDKPEVKDALSAVTEKDVEEIDKLPPERRRLFQQVLRPVVDAAEKANMPVSRAMKALVAAAVITPKGNNQQTLEDLKKRAQQLAPAEPPPPAPAPGPQSRIHPPFVTHVFDSERGIIVPV